MLSLKSIAVVGEILGRVNLPPPPPTNAQTLPQTQ